MQYRKARSIIEYWNKYSYPGRPKTTEVIEAEQAIRRYKKEEPSELTLYQASQAEKREANAAESWEQLQMIVQTLPKEQYDFCLQVFEKRANAKRRRFPTFPTILKMLRQKAKRDEIMQVITQKEGVFRMHVTRAVNRIQELLSNNK